MRILLTGFEPFGKLAVNPSQIVVESMAARAKAASVSEIRTAVLPTEFEGARRKILRLITDIRPELIISLGVDTNSGSIRLERVALNLDDSDAADNAGNTAAANLIVADGPLAYWSTLPLEQMRSVLAEHNIPVSISNHAGTYVCNHVFYSARHEAELLGSNTRCGFVHIPLMSEQLEACEAEVPSLPLALMLEAMDCCLDVLTEQG